MRTSIKNKEEIFGFPWSILSHLFHFIMSTLWDTMIDSIPIIYIKTQRFLLLPFPPTNAETLNIILTFPSSIIQQVSIRKNVSLRGCSKLTPHLDNLRKTISITTACLTSLAMIIKLCCSRHTCSQHHLILWVWLWVGVSLVTLSLLFSSR